MAAAVIVTQKKIMTKMIAAMIRVIDVKTTVVRDT